jgi:hypothetical protein
VTIKPNPTTVKKVGEDGVECAVFVQQLRTEKQTGNVASAQSGCARATVSRQFKITLIFC